jgi:hypothetical protein
MTAYFYQDLFYILAGFFFVGLILGYSLFKKPCHLLVGLTLLLALAGVADAICSYNSDPTVILLAGSGLVLCCGLTLTVFLQFALPQFPKKFIYLYLPTLLLTAAHALTPWLVRGITSGAYGFELKYASGYWLLVVFVACYVLLIAALLLRQVMRSSHAKERERALLLLFVLLLTAYYYSSALVVPFFVEGANIASPLPLTFATMVMVYSCLKYGYFAQ